MLSGKFNLRYKFNSTKDYLLFYYKKAISIVVPLLVFSLVSYLVMTPVSELSIKMFLKGVMNNEIEGVYWFVYTLISILALSPFFTKMVENMSHTDKTVFFWGLIVFNALITLFQFVGNNTFFNYNTFGIITWHAFYFIGYLIEEVADTKNKQNVFIFLGLIGFVVHFLLARFCSNPPVNIYDPSPWMIFEAIALYLTVLRIKFNENRASRLIDEFAGFSFVFYLLHMIVIRLVAGFFPLEVSASITWLSANAIFIISFVVIASLAYIITRFMVKPFNKFMVEWFCNKVIDK